MAPTHRSDDPTPTARLAESDRSTVTVPATEHSATPAPPGYEIVGELGRGGMGVVYKARHLALNRTVALKMILAGGHARVEDRARFLREAAAVAGLRHPNVVQVFEVGEHGGLPYFTLEFIAGGTLTQYAREPLPAREAATFVEAITRGVAHAHANGIIHRDLKPDNVLLDAGVPKVTDFGLAKKLDSNDGLTASGALMGTPSYMAPEQAEGQAKTVGPPADVYALGAILYRLMVGRPPFAAATALETLGLVLEAEPPSPSALVPGIPRDVETICLKCLAKDPARRYPTADALADDLRRYLAGEPIQARPVGSFEKAIKAAKRNRVLVAATTGVIAALALGTGIATWQLFVAREARQATENQLGLTNFALGQVQEEQRKVTAEAERTRRAKEAADHLAAESVASKLFALDLLSQTARFENGKPISLRTAVDRMAATLHERFQHMPLVEADIRCSIGMIYRDLGDLTAAGRELEHAVQIAKVAGGESHEMYLTALHNLAMYYRDCGNATDAENALLKIIALRGPDTDQGLRSRNALVNVYASQGRFEEALANSIQALDAFRTLSGDGHPNTLVALGNRGYALMKLGRLTDAEADFRRSLDGWAKVPNPPTDHVLTVRHNLADLYSLRGADGDLERAITEYTAVLADLRSRHPAGHNAIVITLANYARILELVGRIRDAEPLYREALDDLKKLFGLRHPQSITVATNLALLYDNNGRPVEAERLIKELLPILLEFEPDSWTTAGMLARGGRLALAGERLAEAEPLLVDGYQRMLKAGPALGPARREFVQLRLRTTVETLVELHRKAGNTAELARWRTELAKYSETAPAPRAGR